jgi:thiamine biosynthesis lipoprotein
VRIPACCQLDLGAVGKAWLADRLVERVVDGWGWDAVADMGGDIRAVGVTRPWNIAADPQLDGWPPTVMSVTDAGLATSGVGRRRWRTTADGQAHHIIDPRTGKPAATPWWTASVLAADAKDANAAATAAIVLGDAAPGWLDAAALDAWLVPAPDHPATARRIGRWPSDERAHDPGSATTSASSIRRSPTKAGRR